MAAKEEVVATESFACTVDDDLVVVREGEVVASDHPVVKGREELFESKP